MTYAMKRRRCGIVDFAGLVKMEVLWGKRLNG